MDRLTARDKDYILRCALAAHFTSPTLRAARPLAFREVKRLIDNGYIYNPQGGGYRPTTKGAAVVADALAAALGKAVA